MNLPTVYAAFPSRASRSRFVYARFAKYLDGSVLDVGCFEATLRDLVTSSRYTGIDIAGAPDVRLDLEGITRLPFDDGAFRCVLCIEVLEHIDNLHAIFDELARVSNRYIIVSLPNCWREARLPIGRGKGQVGHYGLPLEKPQDRHKWFFSLTEARRFLEGKAEALGLKFEERFVTEKPRSSLIRLLRKIRYRKDRYQNRYSGTLWAVLEKGNSNCSSEQAAVVTDPKRSRC